MRINAVAQLIVALTIVARLVWPEGAPDAAAPPVVRGPLLHAHNCYPEDGAWADRIDRALATGLRPVAIEQDLVWDAATRTPVVSHGGPLTGKEPSLDEYFFRRVAPVMTQALRDDRREQWPVLILHLDFKTNEPEHHRAVWDLLGRHLDWLTTAERTADPEAQSALRPGPLLVLTENGTGQVDVFHDRVPVGERLRLFGTVPSTSDVPVPGAHDATTRPRDYRRWVNLSWRVVEGEPQPLATAWNDEKIRRLQSLVGRAHENGWWLRFYALNGHTAAANRGWSADYNFGALDIVDVRWRAAIAAGVDLIATDQYEELARLLATDATR